VNTAEFRFYEELNDFLAPSRRKRTFEYSFVGTPSIKDTVEALGVPHTEIDLILIDGQSVRFTHRLRGGERVAVYPMFERFDVRPLYRLRPRPLRRTRFVADVHLGALVRRLRLLGFDTLYDPADSDVRLAAISARERRILLTRDVGLLKHGIVTRGHYVRATDPDQLAVEILRAFELKRDLKPFTRCIVCNGALRGIERAQVAGHVPARVYARYRRFMQCRQCARIYWRGTHYSRMIAIVKALRGLSQGAG
jgi:uncharacterized protein with PIN domain